MTNLMLLYKQRKIKESAEAELTKGEVRRPTQPVHTPRPPCTRHGTSAARPSLSLRHRR